MLQYHIIDDETSEDCRKGQDTSTSSRDGRTDGQADGRTDGWEGGWVFWGGFLDGWVGGWTDGQTYRQTCIISNRSKAKVNVFLSIHRKPDPGKEKFDFWNRKYSFLSL